MSEESSDSLLEGEGGTEGREAGRGGEAAGGEADRGEAVGGEADRGGEAVGRGAESRPLPTGSTAWNMEALLRSRTAPVPVIEFRTETEERRAALILKYEFLRNTLPDLPVELFDYQADVLAAIIDTSTDGHFLSCFPTGYGKTYPMLLASALSPPGSCTIIIPPLVTILQQLEREADKLGLSYVNISKVGISALRSELDKKPSLILSTIDTFTDSKVRQVLLTAKLTVRPVRPLVCIDEAQVLDGDLGWTGFRPYDSETWAWVSAALRPRFLLSSGSMSEASLVRVAGTLGVSRDNIECFFMQPHRPNIYQTVKFVKKMQARNFARDLSFLLPMAAAGKKIQVFCGTRELMNNIAAWFKRMLREMGREDVTVSKLCGNNSNKDTVMEGFGSGRIQILVSTDVSAMGCNTSGLDIGVSLGVPSTRWKYLQQIGRVGRDRGSQAVYVTFFEKNRSLSVIKKEAEEYKKVRAMFTGSNCFKQMLYDHFGLDSCKVYDPVVYERRGHCPSSLCCTSCFLACDCCADKDEETHIRQLLFVDENDPFVVSADNFAHGIKEEEISVFENHDDGEEEEEEEEEEDDAGEEDAGEEDALFLSNVVLVPEV